MTNLTVTFHGEIAQDFSDLSQVTGDTVVAFIRRNRRGAGFPVLAASAGDAVQWAVETARVDGTTAIHVRALNGSEMLHLLEDVAERFGMTSHGVPAFLMERFA
jgi:hypothetical protein